jgi:formylglycine-generating enzyme required for sulfatase activity
MGSDDGEDDEKPVHTVYVDAFYMDIYEVTNAQFQQFCELTGRPLHRHRNDGRPGYGKSNQPVMGTGWQEAVAYCEWVGKRLPTEAEWERAARGGLEGKRYPWGDESPDETKANFNRHVGHPTPVGSYPPNGYGLHDMAGNVEEWCYDWYRPDYYQNSPKRNPQGPDSGFHGWRVVRGGDWHYVPEHLRVSTRRGDYPGPVRGGGYHFGFRCAKSVLQ